MTTKQRNLLAALHGIDAFIDDNAAALGSVVTGDARQKLTALLAQAAAHMAELSSCGQQTRGATIANHTMRRALVREHMAPIASIAHTELRKAPDFTRLRMPKGRVNNRVLITAAEGMAKAAGPLTEIFVTKGRPADFVEQLSAATEALRASHGELSSIRSRQKAAETGIDATLVAGRKLVRMLDSSVKRALGENRALVSAWNAVKHVRRAGQH